MVSAGTTRPLGPRKAASSEEGSSVVRMEWIIAAVVAALVLFVEVFLASEIVGKAFDRTDVSAVDALET